MRWNLRQPGGVLVISAFLLACSSTGGGGGGGSDASATTDLGAGGAIEDGVSGPQDGAAGDGGAQDTTQNDSTTGGGVLEDVAPPDCYSPGAPDVSMADAGAASDAGTGDGATGDAGAAADAGTGDTGAAADGDDAGASGPQVCTYDASKGPTGNECPGGQVCLVGVGKCSGLVIGQCAAKPQLCPAIVASVCGCDGKTYNSLCHAQVSGVIVQSGGACAKPDVPCGGKFGAACKASEICDPACGIDGVGVCRAAPAAVCPNGGAEECGCDGKTYPNACFRQKANVGLAHAGACPTGPSAMTCKLGPVKPVLCKTGYYCKINVAGQCAGKGKCMPVPPVCDKSKKPLCGCDKNTYDNACLAAQAGQSVLSTDPCK